MENLFKRGDIHSLSEIFDHKITGNVANMIREQEFKNREPFQNDQ